jgi:hypothetical protein
VTVHLANVVQLLGKLAADIDSLPHAERDSPKTQLLHHYCDSAGSTATSIVVLAVHAMWRGVAMLERPCLEFWIRAAYCVKHPDYAVWAVNVDFLRGQYNLLQHSLTEHERAKWEGRLEERRRRYAHLGAQSRELSGEIPFHKLRFTDMLDDVLANDAYASIYRAQSMMLHGDSYAAVIASTLDERAAYLSVLNSASSLLNLCRIVANVLHVDIESEHDALHEHLNRLFERYVETEELIEGAS